MWFQNPYRPSRSQMRDMEQLRREMSRLFADSPFGARPTPAYPAMNVWANEESAIVTAELPGCDPDALDISVVGQTLSMSGNRKAEELPEGAIYHRRERSCGGFTRTFQLPFEVDAKQVEATFDKGILHIVLPRAEADKPKKIAIKAV